MRKLLGFTLIEIIVTIGIALTLVGMTAAIGNQAIRNAEFDRVREYIRRELAAAQMDSIGGTLDSSWGVAFFPNAITRYRGSSYATRIMAYDRTVSFGNSVTIRGTTEVDFTRPFGIPSASATIVCTDRTNTATTTVNAAGAIDVH